MWNFFRSYNIASVLLFGGILLTGVQLFAPQAYAADAFPDYMPVEVVEGQLVNEYESTKIFLRKKPAYTKVKYRIASGKSVYDDNPERFELRLIAAATLCVRAEHMMRPSDLIVSGATGTQDEFTWATDPNLRERRSVIYTQEIDDTHYNLLRVCSSLYSFGVRNYGWDAWPKSVRIQSPDGKRDLLISGAELSLYPKFLQKQTLDRNDQICTQVAMGSRPGVGTPGSRSDHPYTLLYYPEIYLSGRGAVPARLNEFLEREEYDRCRNEFLPFLRRRGR